MPIGKILRSKVIIVGVPMLLIVLLAVFLFLNQQQKLNRIPPLDAIPRSAAVVIETDNIISLWERMTEQSNVWPGLSGFEAIKSLTANITYLDSALGSNAAASNILESEKAYLSVHYVGGGVFDFLFLVSVEGFGKKPVIEAILKKISGENNKLMAEKLGGVEFWAIPSKNKKVFYATLYKGVFIGGYSKTLLETSIRHIKEKKSLRKDPSFARLKTFAGKKVEANIYINYGFLAKLLFKHTATGYKEFLDFPASLASWSETDVTLKQNAILLNGYTLADSSSLYLNAFSEQRAQKADVTTILPYNTAAMIFWGFSDFKKYMDNYRVFSGRANREIAALDNYLKKVAGISHKELWNKWMGNEMALVVTQTGFADMKKNTYAVFKAEQPADAIETLQKLEEMVRKRKNSDPDTFSFNDYKINRVNIDFLLSSMFGPLFSNLKGNYYTAIEDYIVFANDTTAIKHFINSYSVKKTLANNENYKSFSDLTSGQANLYFYCNLRRLAAVAPFFTAPPIDSILAENISVLSDYEALAIQYAANETQFYTNIALKYNPGYVDELPAFWETALELAMIKQPFIITDHRDKKQKLIVFDLGNTMYMIDNRGKIIWKLNIPDKVLGDICQVDFYKNKKLQLLFNTSTHLYLVDLTGKMLEKFPVKMPFKAASGLLCADYDQNRKYRILIAGEDRKIYNLNIEGEATKGWKPLETIAPVIKIPQFFQIDRRDILVFEDIDGRVYFTNRRGENRFELSPEFRKSKKNPVYMTKRGNQKFMLVSDRAGTVYKMYSDGTVEKIYLDEFSAAHYFLAFDFNNDEIADYVFVDNQKIKVFSQSREKIFEAELPGEVEYLPVGLIKNGKPAIAMLLKIQKEIIFADMEGIYTPETLMKGTTDFVVKSFGTANKFNIIIGKGNAVKNIPCE